jgi:hypothetical protein
MKFMIGSVFSSFTISVFLLQSMRVYHAFHFTNFISAAVIVLSSLLQIFQASLPYVSTDLADILFTLILVCFCIELG